MSVTYEYLGEHGLILEVWHGVVTPEQWLDCARRQVADPEWLAAPLSLTDLRFADPASDIDEQTIQQAATIFGVHRPRLPGARDAIVASEWIQRTLLYETLIAPYGHKVFIFYDIGTACTWLGVKERKIAEAIARMRGRPGGAAP